MGLDFQIFKLTEKQDKSCLAQIGVEIIFVKVLNFDKDIVM